MSLIETQNEELLASEKLLRELTFQEEQFVLAFMANGENAMSAAAEAGYAVPRVHGWKLLQRPRVQAYVEAARLERRSAMDLILRSKHLTPDKIAADLAEMAGFDLGDILDELGRIDRTKIKGKAKQLQSVEIDGHKTKIKGPDRLAAYRLLMDHLGMLRTSQTNVQVNVDFGERMALRRARALEDR